MAVVAHQRTGGALAVQRRPVRGPCAGKVYATLLDEGTFLCSIPTMYRILRANRLVRERRNQRRHSSDRKPELLATGPNQVWSWDITKLLGPVKWTDFHFYVMLDTFSRYVTGWMVAPAESTVLAQRLIKDTCEKQQGGAIDPTCGSRLLHDIQTGGVAARRPGSHQNAQSALY